MYQWYRGSQDFPAAFASQSFSVSLASLGYWQSGEYRGCGGS